MLFLILVPKNQVYNVQIQLIMLIATQTPERNRLGNGANQDQHQTTKPPPQQDQTRASQARLAFSSYWIGSALFRHAYPTLYPTGKGDIISDIPTGRIVGVSLTQFLALFPTLPLQHLALFPVWA